MEREISSLDPSHSDEDEWTIERLDVAAMYLEGILREMMFLAERLLQRGEANRNDILEIMALRYAVCSTTKQWVPQKNGPEARVFHDWKNVIFIVAARCDILWAAEESRIPDELQELVRYIGTGQERLRAVLPVIESGRGLTVRTDHAIGVISELAPMLQTLKGSAELTIVLDPEVCSVALSPAELKGAVFTLFDNAIQAVAHQAKRNLLLTARVVEEEPSQIQGNSALLVEIADTGVGMPQAVADRIFREQITTKKNGSGQGLRLLGCRLQEIGGYGEVRSLPGVGTTVGLHIPLIRQRDIFL